MILKVSLAAVLVGIAYLSLTPTTSISVGNDKVAHFIAYGTLMANIGLIVLPKRKQFIWGIFFALCYGALMEGGQYFVPGRTVSGMDMVANLSGVMIGAIISWFTYSPIQQLLKRK